MSTITKTHNLIILTRSQRSEEREPERLGELNFYLEALEPRRAQAAREPGHRRAAARRRTARCRSLSPALVVQYQTQLPEKQMLTAKLHELYALNAPAAEANAVAAVPARRKKGGLA